MRMDSLQRFGDLALLDRAPGWDGGVTESWRAVRIEPHEPERPLVLKRLLPGYARDADLVRGFADEAERRSRAEGHGQPTFVESGVLRGEPFVLLEYVSGAHLDELLAAARRQGGVLPLPCAVHLVASLADALDRAHFFHDDAGRLRVQPARDVHPRRVVVGWDGAVCFTGFSSWVGFAAAGSVSASVQEMRCLAPEQLLGDPVDHRADIFALGAVLYELTTGVPPFEAHSDLSTLLRLRDVDVRAPSAENRRVSGELEAVILRCLARTPERRYERASQLAHDLRAVTAELEPAGAADLALLARSLLPTRHEEDLAELAELACADPSVFEGITTPPQPAWEEDTVIESAQQSDAEGAHDAPTVEDGVAPWALALPPERRR
jgi:serine/threonine protein kinase